MSAILPRLLALVLAVVPAIWGTCPGWITGATCCGSNRASPTSAASRCPCCARHDDAKDAPARPRSGQDDHRRSGSDGCPVLEVRNGATAAPAKVDLPEVGGSAAAVASGDVALPGGSRGSDDARPVATGPPARGERVCERLVGTLRQLV